MVAPWQDIENPGWMSLFGSLSWSSACSGLGIVIIFAHGSILNSIAEVRAKSQCCTNACHQ